MTDNENPTAPAPEPGSQYAAAKSELESSLRLGIEVEADDPNLGAAVSALTDPQIEWVAAWLAGEGFTRPGNPPA